MQLRGTWTIGLDADDTLWHNERAFKLTQAHFAELVAPFAESGDLDARLEAAERRNLALYGYGIKGFTLSMVETAIDISGGRVPGSVIAELLAAGRDMLAHPVELLPGVAEAIDTLAPAARLVLITKGDLLDQERKLAESGLADRFDDIAIVSEKTPDTYTRCLGAGPRLMAGNSMRSDVIPAIRSGAHGVHIPQDLAWSLEHADDPKDETLFHRVTEIAELPKLVTRLDAALP